MPSKIREWEIVAGPFSGTYGSVSIGCHTFLQTRRAIKQLHDHVRSEVIKQEALKQQDVRSPYVVQIYDFFETENAILMEFCPTGLDEFLRERLRLHPSGLPYDEARDLLHGILQGLNDAHGADVVHGDVKPANVRFGVGKTEADLGLPKLSDFGAARRLRESTPAVKGSTNWMAPEAIAGGATKESDYFSFGVLAYLVLTGRHPYFANDPSCLTSEEDNITNPKFKPDPVAGIRHDIPPQVAELVMDLLAADLQTRVAAEQSLKAALSRPPEPAEEPPTVVEPLIVRPSREEAEEIRAAYAEARRAFFVNFRPVDAISLLDGFLTRLNWERFRSQRTAGVADLLSLKAFIKNSSGRFQEAATSATSGLEVHADHVSSLHTRGYAFIQLGRYAEAEADLQRALGLTSDPLKRRQINQLLDALMARRAE